MMIDGTVLAIGDKGDLQSRQLFLQQYLNIARPRSIDIIIRNFGLHFT